VSVLDRVRSALAGRAAPGLQSAAQGFLPGLLGDAAAGALVRGIAQGPAGLKQVIPDLKSASPDLIFGEINRRLGQGEAQDSLIRQSQGRSAAAGSPLAGSPTPEAPESLGPVDPWPAAPVWGGLSLREYRQLWEESARTQKAFKNLFHIEIRELKPSRDAPGGAGGFNLFAIDVSFAPCTMPGDAIAIGSGSIDNLNGAERVELRVTTLDDVRGSVKRWFLSKADQATRVDGTFGLPADYLVTVDITHMATTGISESDPRLTHRWLMRPSNMDNELSRRAGELEELQLAFVQFDTFVTPK